MSEASVTEPAAWLALRQAGMMAAVRQYAVDRCNPLIREERVAMDAGEARLRVADSEWWIATTSSRLADEAEGFEVEMRFHCVTGSLASASVSVEIDFSAWSAKNYVLMPSAAYNGNRFLSRRIPYSPKLCFVDDIGPDKPVIVTDIPKLNEGDGPSRIQERSGSMAYPCIGFHSDVSKNGFFLITDQANRFGDHGLGIEESRDRRKATLSITSPRVRERYSYRICDMRWPSDDEPEDFAAGDKVVIRFKVIGFDAPGLQSLFDKYAEIRKPSAKVEPPAVLPLSECFSLLEGKFNRENFVPAHGYYSVGLRQNFLQDWQIGWTGGMITTYPLLFAGNEVTRARVLRNFDWLFPNGISPSGFFWDSGANGTQWFGGDMRKPHTVNWHLIRKSADAVFFILKQFLLMEALGIEVKASWRDGVTRVCDSFSKLWAANRQFGQFVDSITGEIKVGGSTSAAIAPAALVLAASYFKNMGYQEVAEQSAEHFYQHFTRAGMSCGGPGDALQNPDSESWAALIESYMMLHDSTGDAKWAQRAAEGVRQFSTWVVSYDFVFPERSTFGRAGIRTTGSVYANTQNKHSAPGICTLSGLGLLKLFRATGDRFSLELLRDIVRGMPQYLPHPLRPLGNAEPGHMCERVNMTDWEGPERIGETLLMTTWAETSLLLSTIEIPGLYVRPDDSMVMAFDQVSAQVLTDERTRMVVTITNPTSLPACVRIFSETREETKLPLQENYLFTCPIIELSPGKTQNLTFLKSI
jgi:hypothetical protein